MKAVTDFPQWLSPMLVKELRQGMRARIFVSAFLLLQAAMIFVALLGLGLAASHQSVAPSNGFFWTVIGVPLLLVMPMSGFGAIANERRANTLELIFLTRLTARRILFGKWLALLAQTALLVCAVLPYAVLRYFLGGINVTRDLTTLFVLLLGSALISGCAVGLSSHVSRFARGFLVVAIFLVLQFSARFFFFGGMSGSPIRGGSSADWKMWLGFGALGILLLLYMLEFGASKIAPPAENHSTSRRFIALGVAMLIAGLGFSGGRQVLVVLSLILLTTICMSVLVEPIAMVWSVYRPFVRRGFLGRLAGRILYPGWPSGVLFVVVLALALAPICYLQVRHLFALTWIIWTGIAIIGALLFPAALIRTFMPKTRRPALFYSIIQGACALIVLLAYIISEFKLVDVRPVLAAIPTCGLLLAGQSDVVDAGSLRLLLPGTGAITLASLFLLLLRMREPWRQIRALELTHVAEPRPAA